MYLHSFIDEEEEALRPRSQVEVPPSLPDHYEVDRVVIMVRDPWWVYVYWDVSSSTSQACQRTSGSPNLNDIALALRIYMYKNRAGAQSDIMILDADVGRERDMYLNLSRPDTNFFAVLGLREADGKFNELARSEVVCSPRDTFADAVDRTALAASLSIEIEPLRLLVGDALIHPVVASALSVPDSVVPHSVGPLQYVMEAQHLQDVSRAWQESLMPTSPPGGEERYFGSAG